MVLKRSKTFRDINLSFRMHPITNDLMVLKNEDAVKRCVVNIVMTVIGEKPFLNDFGSQMNASLFELDTSLQYISIENQIISALNNYEPRIRIVEVRVTIDGENNEMSAQISYDIIGMDTPTQDIDVLLLPARI